MDVDINFMTVSGNSEGNLSCGHCCFNMTIPYSKININPSMIVAMINLAYMVISWTL